MVHVFAILDFLVGLTVNTSFSSAIVNAAHCLNVRITIFLFRGYLSGLEES